MHDALAQEVESLMGAAIAHARPVAGGDIHESFHVTLRGGDEVFLKGSPDAPPDMFRAEARGLAWLAEPCVLAVPAPIAVGRHVLVLEWMPAGRRVRDFDERLGRGLAALHGSGPARFGLNHDNYIGRLPQPNGADADTRGDWVAFYREQRLRPMIERSAKLLAPLRARLERLLDRLDGIVGPAEAPARLHGDLWGGNLHATAEGAPAILDPACYAGHREMDLAMMRLFGGFGERVFAAYEEAAPLAPGAAERLPLCQLYPLLVHVGLFGGAYVASVERVLAYYE